MNKHMFLANCSALVLGLALASTSSFADQTTTKKNKPSYVEAGSTQAQKSVPKLSADKAVPSSSGPFRLAHHLGLDPNSRIKINGFLSAGVARSSSSIPYSIPEHGAVSHNWNFTANSLFGLQVAGDITKQLSVVAQLVANGDNTNGNNSYAVNLDWGYVKYAINNNVTFRAGRFRLPAFLYSTTQEVGYSYPWVTLPNEVYRLVPFNNINGVETILSRGLGNSNWVASFEPYVGASSSKFDMYTRSNTAVTIAEGDTAVTIAEGDTADFDENDMYGAVVKLSNPYVTLRGTYVRLKLTGTLSVGGTKVNIVNNQNDSFYSVGAKFNYDHIIASSEFAHRDTPAPLASLSGIYGMLGYKVYSFLPNVTYGRMWTTDKHELNREVNSGSVELAQDQESFTGGLDYYINKNLVAKAAFSDIRPLNGTRGLFNTNSPGTVKKNNYLYTAGVDAIF